MPNKIGYEQICQTNARGLNSNDRLLNMVEPSTNKNITPSPQLFDPRCLPPKNNNNLSKKNNI